MIPDFPIDIHKNKIGRIEIFFVSSWLCWFSALLACSVLLRQPTGQRISKVRKQQKNCNSANLILMSIGKSGIIIHQIWMQNNLGFMMLILMCIIAKKVNYVWKLKESITPTFIRWRQPLPVVRNSWRCSAPGSPRSWASFTCQPFIDWGICK